MRLPLAILACLLLAGCGAGADSSGAGAEPQDDGLRVSRSGWKTDFSRHSVPLSQFTSGGPPRDGIPPLDDPKLTRQAAADGWLDDREPVLVVEHGETARAYPFQILVWHEIVNDELGGRPIAVTYCPLCNSVGGLRPARRTAGAAIRHDRKPASLRPGDVGPAQPSRGGSSSPARRSWASSPGPS